MVSNLKFGVCTIVMTQKWIFEALMELKGADIFRAISYFISEWKTSMSDISTISAFRIVGMTLHSNG